MASHWHAHPPPGPPPLPGGLSALPPRGRVARCGYDGRRQNDILKTNGAFYTQPYRPVLTGQDYVYFVIPKGFPADQYTVAMTTQDTTNGAQDAWRGISRLMPKVAWPWVQIGFGLQDRAGLMLLPHRRGMPRFIGDFMPGATYLIPDDVNMNEDRLWALEAHGKRIN